MAAQRKRVAVTEIKVEHKQLDQALIVVNKLTTQLATLKKESGNVKLIADTTQQLRAATKAAETLRTETTRRHKETYPFGIKELELSKVQLQQIKALQKAAADRARAEKKAANEAARAATAAEKANQKQLAAAEKARQVLEEENRILSSQAKTYNELARQTALLNKRRKELDLSTAEGTAQFNKMSAQIRANNAQLTQFDAMVGQHQRNVGNYVGALNSWGAKTKAMFSNIAGAFVGGAGISTAIQLAMGVFQSAARISMDFAKQMSEVKAITKASREEFVMLEKDARRLGATTAFTAKQVGELQTELAKAGFSTNEILAATESVLDLAAATRTDLKEAASIASASLRGMQLPAEEMDRVVNVMAASFTQSRLDINKWRESMKYVAPIAAEAGIDIETLAGWLGKLADAGVEGSTAGTSLRRIITDLGKGSGPATERLKALSERGLNVSDAFDEVGRTAQTALLVLTKNADASDKLTQSFRNSEGAAKEMAATMLDNVAGDITKAQSAIEGFVLSVENGEGVISKAARGIIQSFTDMVSEITKVNEGEASLWRFLAQYNLIGRFLIKSNEEISAELAKERTHREHADETHLQNLIALRQSYAQQAAAMTGAAREQMLQKIVETNKQIEAAEAEIAMAQHSAAAGTTAALKAEQEAQKKDTLEMQRFRAGLMEEGIAKDLEMARIRRLELIGEAEKLGQATAGVEAQYQREIADIRSKYADAEKAKADEAAAKAEQERQAEFEAAKAYVEQMAELRALDAEEWAESEEERNVAAIEREIWKQEQLLELNLLYNEEFSALDKQIAEQRIANYQADLAAATDTTGKKLALKKKETDAQLAFLSVVKMVFGEQTKAGKAVGLLEKGLALKRIILDNKVALAKAWASAPFPANLPAVGAVALQTGLLTKAVEAVKFEKGGIIQGPRHAQGGVKVLGGAAEVEGGEYIVNRKATAIFKPQLDAINSYGFGGRAPMAGVFEVGGMLPTQDRAIRAASANSVTVEQVPVLILEDLQDMIAGQVAAAVVQAGE